MTISLAPLFKILAKDEPAFHKIQAETKVLQHQRDLIVQLDHAMRKELKRGHETFNWEMDPTRRALLDAVYDLDLFDHDQERIYAFTNPSTLSNFMHTLSSGIEKKTQEVQKNQQLTSDQKEELMRFYHALLDIISKLSNTLLTIIQNMR